MIENPNMEWIDNNDGSRRYAFINAGEETFVKQDSKDECDINLILERWRTDGVARLNQDDAQFLDVTEVQDYHAAMNLVSDANSSFEQLPASLRKELKHDPANLLDYIKNPANKEKLLELGILEAVELPPVMSEPVPTEPTPAAPAA